MIVMKNASEGKNNIENSMFEDLKKQEFFNIVYRNNINLEKVIHKNKEQNEDYYKFNIIIDKLVQKKKFTFIEIAIFLIEDVYKDDQIQSAFTEDNFYKLRYELTMIYDTGMEISILDDFFIKD
jgi:hypothetical protein